MTDPAEPTLPAFKLRMFDPEEVFAQYVDGRRVVYLDNNIWIDLRDAENDEAVSCRDACKRVVVEGRAIFPLSYGAVTEVLTNPSRDARERQADLMDALSLGVTFRSPNVVNALETETAYRVFYKGEAAVGRRREVFTMIPDHLGTGWMHFPPGWRRPDLQRFAVHMSDNRDWRRLRWLVDHLPLADMAETHSRHDAKYEQFMAEQLARQREHFSNGRKMDHQALLTEERVFMFKDTVLPAMRTMLFAEHGPEEALNVIRAITEERGEGSRERLAELFQTALPSMEVVAQLFAARSLDPRRKPRANDFMDTEHASVAPVYADAFVTADGHLRSLLVGQKKRWNGIQADILGSVADLSKWIATIE